MRFVGSDSGGGGVAAAGVVVIVASSSVDVAGNRISAGVAK